MTTFSALHTDLYQLTMAQGYWKLGMHNRQAVFELFFRHPPFGGGYAIACGLETAIQWISQYAFTDDDIDYLASVRGSDGQLVFQADFLADLHKLRLSVDIDAIEEGTVVFAREPLIRVMGPLWQCQLLETMLLNLINFPTLIATKASRICKAAEGDSVIDFGLRRAQGPDGGLTASRACYIGGVTATSNVLAGKTFGIPVVGTHAHSWIMAFDNELDAFASYAKVMPNNCVLLVDTYQTLDGVKNAIKVGLQLKQQGYPLFGIRLDSGDLASLSIQARSLLDDAGLKDTKIVGSSDLDENVIRKLKQAGAKIDIWGVGTRMVTGYEQPALGGVYKLVALQDTQQQWQYRLKHSDDPDKRSVPGVHSVQRLFDLEKDLYIKDIVYDIFSNKTLKMDVSKSSSNIKSEELLQPIFRSGKQVYAPPSLIKIQQRTKENLRKFSNSITSLVPTESYPVELPKSTIESPKKDN